MPPVGALWVVEKRPGRAVVHSLPARGKGRWVEPDALRMSVCEVKQVHSRQQLFDASLAVLEILPASTSLGKIES